MVSPGMDLMPEMSRMENQGVIRQISTIMMDTIASTGLPSQSTAGIPTNVNR